jgi:hypothetical protein
MARGLKMPLDNKTIAEGIKQAKAKSGQKKIQSDSRSYTRHSRDRYEVARRQNPRSS